MMDFLAIFDCDGVLVDSERLAARCDALTLSHFGISISAQALEARFAGISTAEMLETVTDLSGVKITLADFEETSKEHLFKLFSQCLEAVSGIQLLLSCGEFQIAVASSSSRERVFHSLNVTGLLPYLSADRIFTPTAAVRPKPAPDFYLQTYSILGFAPDKCLAIEDSVPGILAARAAGLPVIGFTGASHCTVETRALLLEAGASQIAADTRCLCSVIRRHQRTVTDFAKARG